MLPSQSLLGIATDALNNYMPWSNLSPAQIVTNTLPNPNSPSIFYVLLHFILHDFMLAIPLLGSHKPKYIDRDRKSVPRALEIPIQLLQTLNPRLRARQLPRGARSCPSFAYGKERHGAQVKLDDCRHPWHQPSWRAGGPEGTPRRKKAKFGLLCSPRIKLIPAFYGNRSDSLHSQTNSVVLGPDPDKFQGNSGVSGNACRGVSRTTCGCFQTNSEPIVIVPEKILTESQY